MTKQAKPATEPKVIRTALTSSAGIRLKRFMIHASKPSARSLGAYFCPPAAVIIDTIRVSFRVMPILLMPPRLAVSSNWKVVLICHHDDSQIFESSHSTGNPYTGADSYLREQ